MSRPLIFVFPGQSSCDPEMFARAAAVAPKAGARALADFRTLAGHPFDGTFSRNLDVQLAVHLTTRVWRECLLAEGLSPVASAGLSLGEYTHLVQIGALTQDASEVLVAARGRHYDTGPSGVMVAVTGPSATEVEASLATVRDRLGLERGELDISNINSPRQVVIAGRSDAVEVAVERLEDDLYAMTTVIESSIPMHVGRFSPVARAFAPDLLRAPWQPPHATWWSNVTGDAVADPNATTLAANMTDHVDHCARWFPLLAALLRRHPGAVLLEVGPGRVLTGLAARGRGALDAKPLAIDNPHQPGQLSARLSEVARACN